MNKSLSGIYHKGHYSWPYRLLGGLRLLPIGRKRELPLLVCIFKRKFPESICARPVGRNRCPTKVGISYRLARRKATDLYYSAAGLRVSCSRPRPLRLSRGQARAPCTPRGPTRAAVFFIVLFGAPPPFFFGCLGCGLWPFFFRSAGWLVWLCLVVLCVRCSFGCWAWFLCFPNGSVLVGWPRLEWGLVGSVSVFLLFFVLCQTSINIGSLSIIVAILQIFS